MIYAIGDVHGQVNSLINLYSVILDDIKNNNTNDNTIILLGDYVDRGPASKEVLDFLMNLTNTNTLSHIFLWGNHEDMMSKVIDGDDKMVGVWMYNGGYQTLESFGVIKPESPTQVDLSTNILHTYNTWMKDNFKLYYETDDYIFCHSGFINAEVPLSEQENNLLWGRPHKGRYIGYGKTVVHGHTPTDNGKPSEEPYRVCVDVGCGKGTDTLACAVLPNTSTGGLPIRFLQIVPDVFKTSGFV